GTARRDLRLADRFAGTVAPPATADLGRRRRVPDRPERRGGRPGPDRERRRALENVPRNVRHRSAGRIVGRRGAGPPGDQGPRGGRDPRPGRPDERPGDARGDPGPSARSSPAAGPARGRLLLRRRWWPTFLLALDDEWSSGVVHRSVRCVRRLRG